MLSIECAKYLTYIEKYTEDETSCSILDYVLDKLSHNFGFNIEDINSAFEEAKEVLCLSE